MSVTVKLPDVVNTITLTEEHAIMMAEELLAKAGVPSSKHIVRPTEQFHFLTTKLSRSDAPSILMTCFSDINQRANIERLFDLGLASRSRSQIEHKQERLFAEETLRRACEQHGIWEATCDRCEYSCGTNQRGEWVAIGGGASGDYCSDSLDDMCRFLAEPGVKRALDVRYPHTKRAAIQ